MVRRALEELKKMGVVKEIDTDKRGFKLVGERRKWKLRWKYVEALKGKGF
jgi:biotin operon repressor